MNYTKFVDIELSKKITYKTNNHLFYHYEYVNYMYHYYNFSQQDIKNMNLNLQFFEKRYAKHHV